MILYLRDRQVGKPDWRAIGSCITFALSVCVSSQRLWGATTDPAKASLEVSRGRYSYGSYGEWRGMEANAPESLWKEERSKGVLIHPTKIFCMIQLAAIGEGG